MDDRLNNICIALIVISMLLSGCTGESEPELESIEGCMDENAENYNSDATNPDQS